MPLSVLVMFLEGVLGQMRRVLLVHKCVWEFLFVLIYEKMLALTTKGIGLLNVGHGNWVTFL